MLLTELQSTYQTRSNVETFGGYNHNARIGDGEFYDMHDMCTDQYPAMSVRGKHGKFELVQGIDKHKINGLIAKDALCYVDGNYLYINHYKIEGLRLEDSPKQLIAMGAYIIIMPDKKYINTIDYTDMGDIEALFRSTGNAVRYTMCKLDGEDYEDAIVSDTEPSNPENGQLWIDTSAVPHTLKQFAGTSSMWVPIATTYVKISSPNIAANFKQYDGVYISGIDASITELKDLNGKTSVLMDAHRDEDNHGVGDYLVVTGFLDEVRTQESVLTVKREMPVMDFIIESNNRLWGCRYGFDKNGKTVNEIYASKLGDFKNWYCYMGTSTDSYAVSVGSDGVFTGAASYLGYPIFFKENCMYKLYGNFPANYQVQTTPCRGIQKGAGDSIAVVGEALLYKTRNGVAIYEGSLPTEISNAFGGIKYTAVEGEDSWRNGAVGGAVGQKYFISMKSEADDKWYTFSFDLNNNMWMKEFEGRVLQFCTNDGELYYLTDREEVKTWFGSGTMDTDEVEWMVESGRIGTSSPEKKYISRLVVRLMLEVGTRLNIYIQYDSEDKWRHVQTLKGTNMRTFSFPIRPRRCDHFRIKIEGVGAGKIFSITKTIEEGSDK